MTNEFRELTSRLAKGMNFPYAMAILITQDEDSDESKILIKGLQDNIINGICNAADHILSNMKPNDASVFRQALKDVIAADEERRFQKGVTEND